MRFRIPFRCLMVFRRFLSMGRLLRASKSLLKMVYKMWRQEFSIEKFKLNYCPPEDFTTCCFQKTERVLPQWLFYRGLVFLYFLATLLYAAIPVGKNIAKEDEFKFIIFLTNWTYIIETLQFGLAFFNAVIRYKAEKNDPLPMPMERTPQNYQLYWVLFTITLPCSLVVSVIFWVSVYDPVLFPANATNIILHALNSLFMLLDFALVSHPIRLLHFYWPVLYGLIYAVFTVIYHFCGGTGVKGLIPIYKILDWRKPEKALLTCFFCSIFVLILHLLFSLLSMCKTCSKKFMENE